MIIQVSSIIRRDDPTSARSKATLPSPPPQRLPCGLTHPPDLFNLESLRIYGLLDMFVGNLVELDHLVFSQAMRTDGHTYIHSVNIPFLSSRTPTPKRIFPIESQTFYCYTMVIPYMRK